MPPTWMYHPVDAPTGRLFRNDEEREALGPDWVDTPANFTYQDGSPPAAPPQRRKPFWAKRPESA